MPGAASASATVASASTIVACSTSGYHVLQIQGYSTTKGTVQNGKHIESRPFRVAGCTWAIRYYPNGANPECADYAAFFLVFKDRDGATARFSFSFIDQVHLQKPSYVRDASACKFVPNGAWGRYRFVKRGSGAVDAPQGIRGMEDVGARGGCGWCGNWDSGEKGLRNRAGSMCMLFVRALAE
ncbi:hypothetical protein EJB05_27961, partial [Eragrostis curvula]